MAEPTWVRIDLISNPQILNRMEVAPPAEVLQLLGQIEGGKVLPIKAIRYINKGFDSFHIDAARENLHKMEAYSRLHCSYFPLEITAVTTVAKTRRSRLAQQDRIMGILNEARQIMEPPGPDVAPPDYYVNPDDEGRDGE